MSTGRVTLDETRLRIAMAAEGIRSVSELARRSGVSESYLRQVIAGLVPADETRHRLAGALAVDVAALWIPVLAVEFDEGQAP